MQKNRKNTSALLSLVLSVFFSCPNPSNPKKTKIQKKNINDIKDLGIYVVVESNIVVDKGSEFI